MKKIVLLAAIAGTASAAFAQNTGTLLTDGDARFQIGSTSSATAGIPTTNTSTAGLSSAAFVISGGTAGSDQTYQVWWWGRLQTTATNVRENTFFGATSRTTTANTVSYAFPTAAGVTGVTSTMSFALLDDAFGAGTAQMISILTLNNTTGADVAMDLFFHVDNDMPASLSANVQDALIIGSGYRQGVQRDSAGGLNAISIVGYNADGAGLGTFSGINSQLTDSGTDNFIPDFNPGGNTANDLAYLMQWRVTIPAGGSVSLRADLLGSLGNAAFVPTPGAAALIGLGGLVAGRRRRA